MKTLALNLVERIQLKLSKTKAMLLSIAITLIVMVIEISYGYIANSLMLISDGIHMFSHAASLAISLAAIYIAKKSSNEKVETWAALINGIGLLIFIAYIFVESYKRFQNPESIELHSTLSVAVLGLIVNLTTAVILACGGVEDLNTRSAFLHMLADTFSSVAIIVGVLVIYYTDWFWIDALLSAIVAVVVGKWGVELLTSAVKKLR